MGAGPQRCCAGTKQRETGEEHQRAERDLIARVAERDRVSDHRVDVDELAGFLG
jgi:hypothetical protein